jgi:cytochrome c551/c552
MKFTLLDKHHCRDPSHSGHLGPSLELVAAKYAMNDKQKKEIQKNLGD